MGDCISHAGKGWKDWMEGGSRNQHFGDIQQGQPINDGAPTWSIGTVQCFSN